MRQRFPPPPFFFNSTLYIHTNMSLPIVGAFVIVILALSIFLYWTFTCWVAKQTNVDSCFTMFIAALLADGLILKGNTGFAMLVLALLRIDIGSLIGSPRVSHMEFKAVKSGTAITQATTRE